MPAELTEDAFRDLVALNRANIRQQLLRGLAHDLRNQLQVLALGVGGDSPGIGPAITSRIEHALDRMSQLLDLLSRLGQTEPDTVPSADLATGLDQLVTLADLQRGLPSRPIMVEAGPPDVRVGISSTDLEQVLLNLVGVAKAATPDRTDPIRIRVSSHDSWVSLVFAETALASLAGDQPRPSAVNDGYLARRLVERAGGRWAADPAGGELRVTLPTIARG